jgi:hypothetical protein
MAASSTWRRTRTRAGGFVIDSAGLMGAGVNDATHASLHGYWGFDRYDGPGFQLVSASGQPWQLAAADQGALIIGREDTIQLQAGSIACLAGVTLKDSAGRELAAEWTAAGPDSVDIKLAMQQAKPGTLTLLVSQYGVVQPQAIALNAYSEAARLDSFTLHAGDAQGVLRGTRLDEVASLRSMASNSLPASSRPARAWTSCRCSRPTARGAHRSGPATVLPPKCAQGWACAGLTTVIDAPRPRVVLIGKSAQGGGNSGGGNGGGASGGGSAAAAAATYSLPARMNCRRTQADVFGACAGAGSVQL